jgi:two-component system CheB/CheR fusion protein
LASGDRKIKSSLAEDNVLIKFFGRKDFSKFNFDCVTVGNGSLAVDAVMENDFDVILMI